MIKSSKKTLSHARKVAELDKDARRRIVIERDHDTCQRCFVQNGNYHSDGTRAVIQWCHVHGRRDFLLRWEPDNSLALCSRCHMWMDNHKVLGFDWVAKNFPERWSRMVRVLASPRRFKAKQYVRELYEELKADPPSVPMAFNPEACKDLPF